MEGREEMESGIDIEEQPESPLLIAMKGHSSSNKSKIAQELAQFLNFPLIDEEDIIPALQDSLETEHFDDLVVELASFTGARLVFVECSNQNDQDPDYYDAGNVPKLNIDTTKPFHAEDFITGMLKAAALI
uniref:Adenylate kinase n=1 Tax=Populus trichocarpa TaxID=3694 RepID=A0A2K2BSA9_POPTR